MRSSDIYLYRLIAAIDDLLSCQVQVIVNTASFMELKATWAGLHWLAHQQKEFSSAKIKVIDLSQIELTANLQYSGILSQSLLYHRVYQEGLCTLGGEPFGLLMADYHFEFFNQLPPELAELTRKLSELGEMSLCPVVLGMGNLWQHGNPALSCCASKLERLATFSDYDSFRLIREASPASFLAVTWPRFTPGSYKATPVKTKPAGSYRTKTVWCHSGYALLALVLREFDEYGWFSGLQAWGEDVKCGAILPKQTDTLDSMAEIRLTESVESTFTRLGVMPLASGWLDNTTGFFSMTMTGLNSEDESRQLLPPLLIVCRFGHYLKVKTRERIGTTLTASEYAGDLQRWLNQYCSTSDIKDLSLLAASPLKWAKLSVKEEGTSPGEFFATLELLPQLPQGLTVDALRIHLQLSSESNDFLPDNPLK